MNKILFAIAQKIALDLLHAGTHGLWEAFWSVVFESVDLAEKSYIKEGPAKKEIVLQRILGYLNARKNLSAIQKWAVRMFLNRIVDNMIARLNSEVGNDWVAKVRDLKTFLENKIPYLK
jgi:hypothetical protein